MRTAPIRSRAIAFVTGRRAAERLQCFVSPTGTTPIDSVGPAGEGLAYNLVVADFHTYFVGGARILSHDNTIRRPTSAIVPGLANR